MEIQPGMAPSHVSTKEAVMKRFPGKIVMAAIILSCGFVMQVDQSERAGSHKAGPETISRDVAFNTQHTAREVGTQSERSSW